METQLRSRYFLSNLTIFLLVFFGQRLSAQQLQSVLIEPWIVSENAWQTGGVEHYDYDANGFQTDFLYSMWMSESNVFFDYSRQVITNDTSGHPVEKLVSFHDYESGIWETVIRYVNSYDTNGNLLIDGHETYTAGTWTPSSRDVNQYDINNRITFKTSQQWDLNVLVWKNMMQNAYIYNPDGTVLYNINQHWNSQTGAWIDVNREAYIYNAAGKPITKTTEWLDGTTWQPYLRINYAYNGANQCTSSEEQSWNEATADWSEGYMRYDYTYNGDGSLAQSILQVWENSQWENHYRRTYFYNVLAVAQFENNAGISAYPNPANDFIIVSGKQFGDYVISDSMGRIVQTGRFHKEEAINLSGLSAGTYFFRSDANVVKILKQ